MIILYSVKKKTTRRNTVAGNEKQQSGSWFGWIAVAVLCTAVAVALFWNPGTSNATSAKSKDSAVMTVDNMSQAPSLDPIRECCDFPCSSHEMAC